MQSFLKAAYAIVIGAGSAVMASGAQDYPAKPVRFLTGSVGSGSDIVARVLAQRLTERWGRQVVIDNRSGILGAEAVANAAPDGYTLLMGQLATHATAAGFYKKLAYDPVKDFAPLTLVATGPLCLVAHPSLPASNLREFIEYARRHPGTVNYAATGGASNSRLTMLLFSGVGGIDMLYVPYKSMGATITAILGREAQVSFPTVLASLPHINTGRLKPYAVTSGNRFPGAPAIPTMAEAGLPGVESTSWWGTFAPAKTSTLLVARINRDMIEILQSPETRKLMLVQGMEPAPGTPDEFAGFIKSEIAKWGKVIKDAGITPE
jgi:tripartite-type tricarboxylate transporter receptor subunit TctC